MTSQQKELVAELQKFREEVSSLRGTLNSLDTEKESFFHKKDDASKRIRELIHKIKEVKDRRDLFTKEVKDLKVKRDELNKQISEKSIVLNKIKKEKDSILGSLDVKESPSRIKQQIERMEFQIETEGVSFNKEKEIMKKIKELRKEYDNCSVLESFSKKIREVASEVSKLKRESNDIHRAVQEKAKMSQTMHEEILKISPEIDKLKAEEKEAFEKFSDTRKKFYSANTQLKDKLKPMNEIRNELDKIKGERIEKRRHDEESLLKSMEDKVNEKIKKRQKLTTEDLIAFQGTKRKDE
ncbi:MAG TPA: hypothetical protein VJI97_04680 [Candidatus Nanoarchaeia archaeon]|nr:hypothetical protein [Candidatus Nanoarchaeia archaeon]